ncbi:MAG: hypothetical protein ACXWD8_13535, partial [Mycobacterium sp.]
MNFNEVISNARDSLTVKRVYGDVGFRHWRFTALLRVWKTFDSHPEAAEWYRAKSLSLPNNLM